ncbi:MAG TPA: TonB-dependent receptor, partial [Terriglobales bacterium]|nr:TonB-dependent receptor [Terriglobales bacterium]
MMTPPGAFAKSRLIASSVFVILLLAFFTGVTAVSQTTQGTIVGAVHDASSAIVPNAAVVLTSLDAGAIRTTKSGSDGEYRFVDLPAGRYNITVAAPGFARWSADGVVLAVRQELRVDVKLAIGAVRQRVVVTGNEVSAIDTDTPTISGVLTGSDAVNLPVNTRASFGGTSAYNILGELPGMQPDHSGFSLQGALPYQTEVTVDGMTLKDPGGDGVIGDAFPSSESISQIRADGVLANAEFGDPGQVVVTTRGGTNHLHGSAFLYYQSSAFDAIPYTYPTTATKPSLQGKTFGASVGGPVVMPHHIYNGHNKTFFFGAYEGWRHPAQTVLFEKVPSTLMKKGDFSAYHSPGFSGLRDPYTGESFGTQIPDGAISSIAKNVLSQFYPDPNIGNPADYSDDSKANFQENVDASGHSDQFDLRGDQYVGANQRFLVWARYTWKNFPTNSAQELRVPSRINNSQNRVLRVDTNWIIAPNLINEGGFGFTRFTSGSSNGFNGLAWTQAQGWQGLQNLYYNGIPEMDFNFIQSLNADRLTGLNKSFTYDYTDALIWTRGRHIVKFGFDIQHLEALSPLGFNGADNYGTYNFHTSGSAGLFTGVDFADFLLGIPNQTFYDVVKQDNDGLSMHYAAYAQDEWRLNRRLTLSYGVRYELHPGYFDRYGDIANFDPNVSGSGRVVYPQGKEALLAQAYLASANACDPDGV